MKISHKWLQTYFSKPIPSSDEIASLLTFHIFEVEGIEKKTDDDILDVKVLPDRASYCLSHEGVARELSALIPNNEFIPRKIEEVDASDEPTTVEASIEAGDVCDVYNTLRIINISKPNSPEWLQTKLHAMGQRSINLFVDLANFVMFDIGQPMHAFDGEKVKGGLVTRYARAGETITTLDNKNVILDSSIVIIADDSNPLAIAGIKGGKIAETTTLSKHIILESAHFDSSYVRKTGTKLNIKTDSSKRFENGISALESARALKYFVSLLRKEDPEIVVSRMTSVGSPRINEVKINVSAAFISEKLGKNLSADEIVGVLNKANVNARHEGGSIVVYPEHYRKDLNIPEDIVDEVGRVYGYENIEGVVPTIKGDISINQEIAYKNTVRNFLIAKGYSEIQTYSLAPKGNIEILNPLSEDKKYLRTNLSEQVEEKIKNNLYYADLLGLSKIKVFEFGRVWQGGREYLSLCVGIGYKKVAKGERVNDEIKVVRDELFEKLGSKIEILCTVDDSGGIISKDGKSIGLTNNIEGMLEVDFDTLIKGLPVLTDDVSVDVPKEVFKYKSPSPYPFMVRDIAVFVPGGLDNESKLWGVIEKHVGDLLVRHELFDVFEKKNKETGEVEKTSFAFRLVFQSYEKTLTDEEANKIMGHINDAILEQKWEVR
jgi:phenylalanyl-tRNA synthetase beta chain